MQTAPHFLLCCAVRSRWVHYFEVMRSLWCCSCCQHSLPRCCLPAHLLLFALLQKYVRIKRSGGSSPGQTTLFLQRFLLRPMPLGADADEVYFTISQSSTATKYSSLKSKCQRTYDKDRDELTLDVSTVSQSAVFMPLVSSLDCLLALS
jgi:hypothetical protein